MTITPDHPFSDPELHRGVAEAMAAAALTPAALAEPAWIERHLSLAQDLAWLSARLPESADGLELGADFTADLCREAGRHLIGGPLRETAVLLPALAAEWPALGPVVAGVAAGRVRLTLAEELPGGDLLVPWLRQSTHLVRLVATEAGLAVTLLPLEGVAAEDLQPLDPTSTLARIRLADLPAVAPHLLGPEAAERVWAEFDLATAAELLGLAEALLARTLAHVRDRRQFGAAIGGFQALKHRLADVHVANTAARLAIGGGLRREAGAQEIRIARALAADAAFGASAAALQLHGGLGFSWETDLHLYLKRAHRLSVMRGGTEALRQAAGAEMIRAALSSAA